MSFLLRAQDVRVDIGERLLFSIPELTVEDGERIGLVGANGAGKTTLLSVLADVRQPDEGRIQRNGTIAWIRQFGEDDGEGAQADAHIRSAFGVVDSPRRSGGERTRAAIADAVSSGATLLLADEPTSNLDLAGIDKLEETLLAYPGAVILVCHDRALLDRVCTRVWELEAGKLRDFPGTYGEWLEEKDRERGFQQFEYEQYRKEKRRLTQSMKDLHQHASNMNRPPSRMSNSEWQLHKGKAAQKRGKVAQGVSVLATRIEQLEEKERPVDLPDIRMAISDPAPIVSKVALRVKGLRVEYPGRVLVENAEFEIPACRRTVCVGPNGAGKTSLVRRILAGDPAATFASGISVGYFDQDHDGLDGDKTALENARAHSDRPESAVRTVLARLGIAGDDVHKRASVLSGGERAKVCFASLFVSTHNFLLLDEPTNYLDVYTMEALEELLLAWTGTLLVISHDRRLNERIAQHVLTIEQGKATRFDGDWDAYLESRRPKPKREMDIAAEEARVRMRMAEVTSRLSMPIPAEERDRLDAQWHDLVRELRAIEEGKRAKAKRRA